MQITPTTASQDYRRHSSVRSKPRQTSKKALDEMILAVKLLEKKAAEQSSKEKPQGGFRLGSFFKVILLTAALVPTGMRVFKNLANSSSDSTTPGVCLSSVVMTQGMICPWVQTTEQSGPIKEENLFDCLEPHKKELEEMYKNPKINVGQWKCLGEGLSKFVFIHEECPGWVVKIPRDQILENIQWDYQNFQWIKGMASKFDRISLPKSHLYPIENGAVLVQEIFNLEKFQGTVEQKEAGKQFNDFTKATGLCDVYPTVALNAGILTGSTPPKIGFIDFNCIESRPSVVFMGRI